MEITKEFEDLAELFKVIGHPVRLTILRGLMQRECCVKDIWDCLGLPQSTVSQHLSVMKAKGILKVRKKGVSREYYVAHPFMQKLVGMIVEDYGSCSK